MPLRERLGRILSPFCFSIIANNPVHVSTVLMFIFVGLSCLAQAQQTGQAPALQRAEAQGTPQPSTVTVPAGTKIALVLTHAIQSRHIHSGEHIYAQVSFPVTAGDEVVVPAGTFVQCTVDRLRRNSGRAELYLRSAALTFPNGYVASISGPLTMESNDGYAFKDPSDGRKVGAIVLPLAGLGLGALIGHAAESKGTTINGLPVPSGSMATAIGAAVGSAVGGVGSLVLVTSSRDFFLDVGSALDMVLPQSVSLDRNRIMDAVSYSNIHPVEPILIAPRAVIGNAAQFPGDCSAGQQWCGGRCMDTISFVTDSANCGRCGNSCSFSEQCTGGSCTCGPTYTMCMGSCVSNSSFLSDSSNCGRCGNHCSFGETCMGGSCMKTTP